MRTRTAAAAAVLLIAALAACSGEDKPNAKASSSESMMSDAEVDEFEKELEDLNKEADELLDDIDELEESPSDEPVVEDEPTETGPVTAFTEGTYLVGEDIKAGSYKTAGAIDGACYWARSKNDSGDLDAIITNHLGEGPARVTVNKGEFFETSGCEEWALVK